MVTVTYTTAEVLAATGATYRQADYYWRERHGRTGSGRPRTWRMADVIRLAVAMDLHALTPPPRVNRGGRTGRLTNVVLDRLDDTTCMTADTVVLGDRDVRLVVDLAAIRARL